MQHSYWQISLQSSHGYYFVKRDWNGSAILPIIFKMVISLIVIVVTSVSLFLNYFSKYYILSFSR